LEYSMELEIMPEIEPMDFATLELERVKILVEDSEVDKALEQLASDRKTTRDLESPRPAASGDVLIMDFAGTVDGEAYPGMDAEDHSLELGSNSFIEGFEDQLIGVEAGETRDVKVTFPEAYANDTMAGQEAIFVCKIKEIKESVPAEIDEEFASSFGAESLDDLKGKVSESLSGQYGQASRERMKRQLLDLLADNHSFEVPGGMVETEFDSIWQQVEKDKEAGQLDAEDQDKPEEELKSEYGKIAERRVRLGLLLSEVGRVNAIEASPEEINQEITRRAMSMPGQEQQIFELFQKNPELQAQIQAPLFEDKVVDYIFSLAQVADREVTFEDFKAEAEAEEESA